MLDQPDTVVEQPTCDPAACTASDCPCRAALTDSGVGKSAAILGTAPAAAITPTLSGGHDHAGVYAPVDHNHDTNYVPPSRRLDTAGSIVGGGDLSTHRSVTLVNDSATPGPNMYYGTDGDGDKGWLPAGPTAVAAPVTSFFGRTGDVEPEVGDYNAAQVTSTPLTGVPATNVQDALTQLNNNKVPVSRLVGTAGSLIGGGKLDNHRTLQLAGDAASPGNNRYYGTNASGAKGFFPLPTGGSGTPTSASASSVSVTPSGGLSATDVQAALQELDGEKAAVGHSHTGATLTDKGDFYGKTRGGTLRETAGVIDVNIAGVAEKTAPSVTDLVPIWDATAGAQRHLKIGNLPAGRAITPPRGEDVTIKLELPAAVDRRDFLLGFTATGAVTTTRVATVAKLDQLVGQTIDGIQAVNTMADLRALTPPASGSATVYLRGYHAPGDGGEGIFTYNPTNNALDNGGTVIPPNVGVGRWLRQITGPLHFEWFGARGDGVTRDGAAMAKTFAAAQGKIVKVTAGKIFWYTNGVISLPNDLTVEGPGTIHITEAANWFEIGLRTTVRGVRFTDTVGHRNSHTFVHLANPNVQANLEFILEECRFENYQGLALHAEGASRVTIRHNRYVGASPAYSDLSQWHAFYAISAEDWIFAGNDIRNASKCIAIFGGRRCRIIGNHCSRAISAIHFGTTDAMTPHWRGTLNQLNVISNNTVEDFFEEGISFDAYQAKPSTNAQNQRLAIGTVSSVTDPADGNKITLKLRETGTFDAGWADGYFIGLQSGASQGMLLPIIASGSLGSNASISVAKTSAELPSLIAGGDRLFIFAGHIQNTITSNTIDNKNNFTDIQNYNTGIGLWGCAWYNIVSNNTVNAYDICLSVSGVSSNILDSVHGACAMNTFMGNSLTISWSDTRPTLSIDIERPAIRVGTTYVGTILTGPVCHGTKVLNNMISRCGSLCIGCRNDHNTLLDGNTISGTSPKLNITSTTNLIIGKNYGATGKLILETDLVKSGTNVYKFI